jgi:hypothetical protein
MPALYTAPLRDFLNINPEQLLGKLTSGLAQEGFDTTKLTTDSWQREITELQEAFGGLVKELPSAAQWPILFEYVLPIVGQRVDCVLLADDVIFVIEYKGGSSTSARAALQQAQEYALNLADFHEASRRRTAIPVAVGAFKTAVPLDLTSEHQGAAVHLEELPDTIVRSHQQWGGKGAPLEASEWNNSRYFPVPTIVQAASAIYSDHNVKDLANSRAGTDNLETTQKAVAKSVRDARLRGVKKLLVITGVPGAGKTLAGLNAVQLLAQELDLEVEQASFLSGNGPLVAVIQEALKRSLGASRHALGRSVRSRIREIHRFVRDSYGDSRAPADRLIVFDEAQRAWTAAKNLKKFKRDVSEPEMVLEIMGRHDGWAVIVALVGGGQEIHGGEAGLAAWGDTIAKHPEWEVVTSPEAVVGGPSVAGSRLFREGYSAVTKVEREPALHLAISKRSYETDVTAAWVNAVLDGHAEEALQLAAKDLPIYLTRDLKVARSWLLAKAKGNRRAGLVASSGAARLRAEGVETPTFNFLGGIDYVKWFLEPAGDHRSSNQLEVALSEFEMQGLEIDVAGLLWGGDLVFPEGKVVARTLRGRKWCVVDGMGDPQASADDPRIRIQNKYRVLLTRFRKGMVIFVPLGSTDDPTRAPADFDSVSEYLLGCGVRSLN